MLLFCAPTFAKLRPCGASKFFCLQRGSGRLIKSNVAPKLCDTRHIFLCSPVADGSKNNCDFAGFDLNGDLHNKSSHAPVKTAIIIQLYFQRTACIFCKLCYLFIGPGFPGPCFALPSFRSAVLPCRVPRQVLEEVHADVFKFRTDQSEAEEENPHVVLRAFGAEGTLVFRARALCVFGEGGDGEAEDNVTFDLSGMGSPIKRSIMGSFP